MYKQSFACLALVGAATYGAACSSSDTSTSTTDAGSVSDASALQDGTALTDTGALSDAKSNGDSAVDAANADASADASLDAVTDAAMEAAAPACDVTKPFGTPTVVSSLDSADDPGTRGARLSADWITAYYQAGSFIYSATRTAVADAGFTGGGPILPLKLSDAGVADVQTSPTISADGLTIYFDSTVSGVAQIYFAVRATVTDPFGAPQPVAGLADPAPTGQPFLRANGKEIYFASSRTWAVDGGADTNLGGMDIYRARVTAPGIVDMLEHVPALSSAFNDTLPIVSGDGLTAYVQRTLPASHAKIFSASRAAKTDPFGAPTLVAELDGGANVNDGPTWISADNCTIYLYSFRLGGGVNAPHIWTATRGM